MPNQPETEQSEGYSDNSESDVEVHIKKEVILAGGDAVHHYKAPKPWTIRKPEYDKPLPLPKDTPALKPSRDVEKGVNREHATLPSIEANRSSPFESTKSESLISKLDFENIFTDLKQDYEKIKESNTANELSSIAKKNNENDGTLQTVDKQLRRIQTDKRDFTDFVSENDSIEYTSALDSKQDHVEQPFQKENDSPRTLLISKDSRDFKKEDSKVKLGWKPIKRVEYELIGERKDQPVKKSVKQMKASPVKTSSPRPKNITLKFNDVSGSTADLSGAEYFADKSIQQSDWAFTDFTIKGRASHGVSASDFSTNDPKSTIISVVDSIQGTTVTEKKKDTEHERQNVKEMEPIAEVVIDRYESRVMDRHYPDESHFKAVEFVIPRLKTDATDEFDHDSESAKSLRLAEEGRLPERMKSSSVLMDDTILSSLIRSVMSLSNSAVILKAANDIKKNEKLREMMSISPPPVSLYFLEELARKEAELTKYQPSDKYLDQYENVLDELEDNIDIYFMNPEDTLKSRQMFWKDKLSDLKHRLLTVLPKKQVSETDKNAKGDKQEYAGVVDRNECSQFEENRILLPEKDDKKVELSIDSGSQDRCDTEGQEANVKILKRQFDTVLQEYMNLVKPYEVSDIHKGKSFPFLKSSRYGHIDPGWKKNFDQVLVEYMSIIPCYITGQDETFRGRMKTQGNYLENVQALKSKQTLGSKRQVNVATPSPNNITDVPKKQRMYHPIVTSPTTTPVTKLRSRSIAEGREPNMQLQVAESERKKVSPRIPASHNQDYKAISSESDVRSEFLEVKTVEGEREATKIQQNVIESHPNIVDDLSLDTNTEAAKTPETQHHKKGKGKRKKKLVNLKTSIDTTGGEQANVSVTAKPEKNILIGYDQIKENKKIEESEKLGVISHSIKAKQNVEKDDPTKSTDKRAIFAAGVGFEESKASQWSENIYKDWLQEIESKALSLQTNESQVQIESDSVVDMGTISYQDDKIFAACTEALVNLDSGRTIKGDIDVYGRNYDWAFWMRIAEECRSNPLSKELLNKHSEILEHLTSGKFIGMPQEVRSLIWMHFSDNSRPNNMLPAEFACEDISALEKERIEKDIENIFPENNNFAEDKPKPKLRKLLMSYLASDPTVVYDQGLPFIAGIIVLQQNEKNALVLLKRIMYHYDLRREYTPGVEGLRLNLYQYDQLLADIAPDLAKHFDAIGVKSEAFANQWYMTMFSYQMPLEFVFHVFDYVLLEGSLALHKLALTLTLSNKAKLMGLNSASDIYAALGKDILSPFGLDYHKIFIESEKINLDKDTLENNQKEFYELSRQSQFMASADEIVACKMEGQKLLRQLQILTEKFQHVLQERYALKREVINQRLALLEEKRRSYELSSELYQTRTSWAFDMKVSQAEVNSLSFLYDHRIKTLEKKIQHLEEGHRCPNCKK
jgi:hypothetical protein